MAQRAASPAEAMKSAINIARALTIGLRSWGFYPPEHPAVVSAVDRLLTSTAEAAAGGTLQIAVTPTALLVDGTPLESSETAVMECAALLHDRDILQMTFMAAPPETSIKNLLTVLALDRETRRARGGPAAIWAEYDDATILVEQIDYQEVLEREVDEGPARRDGTWKNIVRSIIMGRATFTTEEQERLLEISKDVGAISELGKDCKEPYQTADGSPLVTTQAATILAVYRHIAKTVQALEPERAKEVMQSLTLATGTLDPATAFELLKQEDRPDDPLPIMGHIKQNFDDQQVALLLAKALAQPGHPTNRLAQVLDTLAPDDTRKRRVLKLAERLISERDFGSKRPLDDIRQSLDELLLKYDEKQYVGKDYRESMDQAGGRAIAMAAKNLPPELEEWLATLGHESVRRLSGQLLMDLLKNEKKTERMAETARDMAGFVEELLLAGAFADAAPVVDALNEAAKGKLAAQACRDAVEHVAASSAYSEVALNLADQSEDEYKAFLKLSVAVGAGAVKPIIAAYRHEHGGVGAERASSILIAIAIPALPHLAAGIEEREWFVQRELAKVLGRIGTAAAVPALQVLLRRTDPRVIQVAVASLARIDDPAATRAVQTVLKAAAGPARKAVIEALVGLKEPRVVPILARVLQESDPFGEDHQLVLDTMGAISAIKDDRAIPPLTTVAKHRRFSAWGKTKALRTTALGSLKQIGTPKAMDAIGDLSRNGDFFLKRMAKAAAKRQ